MKNYINKIIVGIFSFALIFVGQSAFASGIWNTASNDCPTINVANTNGRAGWGNPCWNGTNISANPGDIINVRVYYHNTGTVTANNTKLILNAQTGSSTSHSFNTQITSSQGNLSSGSVSINVPSSQTLTFGSVIWYTGNTNQTVTTLLNGQDGSEILSSQGLYIGDITPGWPSQGSAVVSFTVGNNTTPTYNNCSINSFSSNPSSVTSGNSATLNWNTNDCTNVNISNLSYNVPTSGSQAVWPTYTTTYTLTANGSNGTTQTRSTTVYVDQTSSTCDISSFTASDTSISEGDYSTLRWNTNNCNRVSISNFGDVAQDGSKNVYPNGDTTYVLTAYSSNGSSQSESVRIYVDNNNNSNCTIDSYTASNTYIKQGDAVTLRWSTSNCNSVNISNIGSVSSDGSKVIYPSSTTTYVLRASGDNSESRSIQVNVDYNQVVTPIYNAGVVTTVATNISQTGAQVNGLITNSNYANANTYFEYGTEVTLGSRTVSRTTTGNTSFNDYLTNLSPSTIYFFRAVSEGTNGTSRGGIEIFQTLGNVNNNTPIVKQVIVQGTTVTGTASPIMLKIENRYQSIGVGDVMDYVVFYKNIGKTKLTSPMVQVFIPKGITLTNASRGTFSTDNNTLSVPLEDLAPGAEGTIYLQTRVDSMESNLAQVVTTAVLVYTNPNSAQENAMAYVLNNPKLTDGSVLGASAFFGNMFGMSLVGWLILIIFIMLLALLARSFYGHRATATAPINH
jgi:hypothetical protein